MSVASRNSVFAATAGQVVALDRATGAELWRTRLRLTGAMSLVGDGSHLYVSCQGQVCCLDTATGAVLWRNPLRGLGLSQVALWASGAGTASEPVVAVGRPSRGKLR